MIEKRDGVLWFCDEQGNCKRVPSPVECDQRILNRRNDLEAFFWELSEWLGHRRSPTMEAWASESYRALSDAYDRFIANKHEENL